LLLGLPLYGYVINSTATSLTEIAVPPPTFPIAYNKQGAYEAADHARNGAADKKIGILAAGDLSSYYGQQIAFSDLVANGALVKLEDGTYTGTNGYTYGMNNPITSVMCCSCRHSMG
jgi:chitinase